MGRHSLSPIPNLPASLQTGRVPFGGNAARLPETPPLRCNGLELPETWRFERSKKTDRPGTI